MEPLVIEGTKSTPQVNLNKEKGIFQFVGNSLPENAMEFYRPVIQWVTEYLNNPNPETELVFKLVYFNTASSKIIYELIKQHVSLKNNGKTITVKWYYPEEDEDMLETGKDYADLTKLPFEFIALM